VLLVDLDPHASLSHYCLPEGDLQLGIYDIFVAEAPLDGPACQNLVHQTHLKNIDLLPASMNLATLDGMYGHVKGMGLRLKNALHQLDYDVILIDCPPMLGVLMINALAACQHVIIPVQVEHLALRGLDKMMQSLLMMQYKLSKQLDVTIVPTMFDKRLKANALAYRALSDKYAGALFDNVIPIDTHFRDASRLGKPISWLYRHSRGGIAYKYLLTALLKQAKPFVKARAEVA
jgi:chromosome partitioning protein